MIREPTGGVAVVQLGGRMGHGVARILHGAGLLERLYTDLHAGQNVARWAVRLSRIPGCAPLARLVGRASGLPPGRVSVAAGLGIAYAVRRRLLAPGQDPRAVFLWAGDRLAAHAIRHGAGHASAVYAYASAAERVFVEAETRGEFRILEQPCAPVAVEEELAEEERVRWPGWETQPDRQYSELCRKREQQEWTLAQRIICPSEFVRLGVVRWGGDAARCRVVPYGIDLPSAAAAPRIGRADGAFRVLFVGSVRLLKGIPYLLEAARGLLDRPIRFRIVGPVLCDPARFRQALPANVEWIGAIPHARIWQQYQEADCLCLPSLSEGSATVVYEALACGLPAVVTENCGSIVRDGIEGRVVPIRDPNALAAAIRGMADNPRSWNAMCEAAGNRSEFGSFEAYRQRLLDVVRPPWPVVPGTDAMRES